MSRRTFLPNWWSPERSFVELWWCPIISTKPSVQPWVAQGISMWVTHKVWRMKVCFWETQVLSAVSPESHTWDPCSCMSEHIYDAVRVVFFPSNNVFNNSWIIFKVHGLDPSLFIQTGSRKCRECSVLASCILLTLQYQLSRKVRSW